MRLLEMFTLDEKKYSIKHQTYFVKILGGAWNAKHSESVLIQLFKIFITLSRLREKEASLDRYLFWYYHFVTYRPTTFALEYLSLSQPTQISLFHCCPKDQIRSWVFRWGRPLQICFDWSACLANFDEQPWFLTCTGHCTVHCGDHGTITAYVWFL